MIQPCKLTAKGSLQGMEYICQLKMIHGDLAARNVLLFSADGQGSEPVTAKLADFGLSHKLSRGQSGTYYYSIKKSTVRCDLPVFWYVGTSVSQLGEAVYCFLYVSVCKIAPQCLISPAHNL